MNIAIASNWESLIERLIATGRDRDASEVVVAGLSRLEAGDVEVYPAGSLAHLYTDEENRREMQLAAEMPVPEPFEV